MAVFPSLPVCGFREGATKLVSAVFTREGAFTFMSYYKYM
jgi:hypothetical protein